MTSSIFWVQCPRCDGRFYCHSGELRHTDWKVLCPYCENQFHQDESPYLWE